MGDYTEYVEYDVVCRVVSDIDNDGLPNREQAVISRLHQRGMYEGYTSEMERDLDSLVRFVCENT